MLCIENLLRNLTMKEFRKSVYICPSYHKKSSVLFFLRHTVYVISETRSNSVISQTMNSAIALQNKLSDPARSKDFSKVNRRNRAWQHYTEVLSGMEKFHTFTHTSSRTVATNLFHDQSSRSFDGVLSTWCVHVVQVVDFFARRTRKIFCKSQRLHNYIRMVYCPKSESS